MGVVSLKLFQLTYAYLLKSFSDIYPDPARDQNGLKNFHWQRML